MRPTDARCISKRHHWTQFNLYNTMWQTVFLCWGGFCSGGKQHCALKKKRTTWYGEALGGLPKGRERRGGEEQPGVWRVPRPCCHVGTPPRGGGTGMRSQLKASIFHHTHGRPRPQFSGWEPRYHRVEINPPRCVPSDQHANCWFIPSHGAMCYTEHWIY